MNKSDDLSELQNDRNFLELKYACERSKEIYANLDDDMVLLPDQKWNVPHKHPPVCTSQKCAAIPLYEQSSLIGTLLSDANDSQIGSIMPKFTFSDDNGNDEL